MLKEQMKEATAKRSRALTDILRDNSGIGPGYRHAPKVVTPGEAFHHSGAVLKWYAVHPEERPVPNEIAQLARSFLSRNDLEAKGFGFVILHRCGNDFYFLIVSTWRNNNELWETVFYKNGEAMADFTVWPRETTHKPTYCVWELVPLWHEQKAWERFLRSARDEAAARAWMGDLYAGAA
jgi:hypothetical protein